MPVPYPGNYGTPMLPEYQSAIASPTTQTPLSGADPRLSVGSYLNQQLGALSTNLGSSTGPVNSQSQLQHPGDAVMPGQNQQNAQSQVGQSISDTNSRMLSWANVKQQQQRAQQAVPQQQATPTVQAQPQQQAAPSRPTWQTNGALSSARNQALSTASSYVGDRYVLGGLSHQGIDCSGLVMAVYDQFGYGKYLNSHLAGHQAAAIPGVRTSIANLRPGDLVAWNDGSHIAIYAGNGNIIEAANERVGVVQRRLWSSNVFGIHLTLPGE